VQHLSKRSLKDKLKSNSSIFCFWSPQFIKEKLYRAREGVVCCLNGLQKALSLLSSIPYSYSFITAFEGYYEKHISYWKNWKVGCGTQRVHIDYVHRSSIQSQALADFIVDWTPGAQEEEASKDTEAWTVFCDGSWGTFGAGAAAVLVAPSIGASEIKSNGNKKGYFENWFSSYCWSRGQKQQGTRSEAWKYLDAVWRLEASFEGFSVKNIPRGENEHADLLAKSAAQGLPIPSEVFFETIKAPSVELMERAILNISPVHSEDWRTEIISFLQGNCLSDDEVYNKRMEARTRPYVIIEGELYKYGVCSPLLNCLSRTEGI
jgi:hypothetical protein